MEMFEIGKEYKIETKKGIFYTAKIIDFDKTKVKFSTIRNEIIILDLENVEYGMEMHRSEFNEKKYYK